MVKDSDIGQGQEQDSANHMNRITTETTKETTEVTTMQIPIAVSGS